MGFFKKLFKGVGKIFKKIGKGIKKAFKGIGKFMGKIGIIGQIGLSLLLPGIGSLLGGAAGGMMASSNALIRGAGSFLNAAVNVGSSVGKMFSSVTKGVTNVIGNVAGSVLNKIPGATNLVKNVTSSLGINKGAGIDMANASFSGAVEAAQNAVTDFAGAGRDLFSMESITSPNKYISSNTMAKINKLDVDLQKDLDAGKTIGSDPYTQAQIDAQSVVKKPLEASKTIGSDPTTQSMIDAESVISKEVPMAKDSLLSPTQQRGLDFTKDFSPTKIDGTVAYKVASGEVMYAPEGILETMQQQGLDTSSMKQLNFVELGIEKGKESLGSYVSGKVEALQDPVALAKAGFSTYQASRQEDQMLAAQQAAMSGDVINVGQYQDPSAFLTYQTQNTVAPIQGFQAPALYDAPLSSWGQQFMFDPFAQQPMRTA
jgi:hypothetical protein